MRADIAELWAKALESGEYQQTHETLRDDNGFCCLGVLCDLAIKSGEVGGSWDNGAFIRVLGNPKEEPDAEYEQLPLCVREWAGMRSNDGTLSAWAEPKTLILANDGERDISVPELKYKVAPKSFREIAELIRENASAL